jgi:hypothetical protein
MMRAMSNAEPDDALPLVALIDCGLSREGRAIWFGRKRPLRFQCDDVQSRCRRAVHRRDE